MSSFETCHNLQLIDIADLRSVAERLPADPCIRQRATDREMEIVRPRLGCQAVLERLTQHVDPELSAGSIDKRLHTAIDLEPTTPERLHPDHDPLGRLRLAHEGVPMPARRDSERRALAQGEDVPHGGGDIGDGAGVEHGRRQEAALVAEVPCHGGDVMEAEMAVEAQRAEGREHVLVGDVHGQPGERQQDQQLEAVHQCWRLHGGRPASSSPQFIIRQTNKKDGSSAGWRWAVRKLGIGRHQREKKLRVVAGGVRVC